MSSKTPMNTANQPISQVMTRHPKSVRTCVLLRKPTEGAKQTPVDYLGFDIPERFVVGYGLDFNDHHRNLPDIVTLKPHVLEGRLHG